MATKPDDNVEPDLSHASRARISDERFLDALLPEWQTAHAIRKTLIAQGEKIAYGTIYTRLAKLTEKNPDLIEAGALPARWRLRPPREGAQRDHTTSIRGSRPRSQISKQSANYLPPAAITDVRERVAAGDAPLRTFEPSLHHADCFEAMKKIADGSIDLILTDAPYSLTELDIDAKIDLPALWKEYRRIIKPTGNVVMFGSQPFTTRLISAALDLFKHNLVWIKNRATETLRVRNRPLKQHEDILVFSRGATIQSGRSSRRCTFNPLGQISAGMKKLGVREQSAYLQNKHRAGLVYEATTNNPRSTMFCPKDKEHFHPFQKPVDLLEYLIRTYSNEGDVVLDSFMGSGSTCVAAMRSGRRSIGIEKSEEHFEIASNRIASVPRSPSVEAVNEDTSVRSSESSLVSSNDNTLLLTPTMSSTDWSIYQGDCLDVMRRMPSGSVDLIVTSPPYNLGMTSKGKRRGPWKGNFWPNAALSEGYASYTDDLPPAEYIQWQKDVLAECWRLLSDDGAIYYVHKPRIQEGLLQTPLDLNPGLPVRQIVSWNRSGGMNVNKKFYLPVHEWIVIFAKAGFHLVSTAAACCFKDVWTIAPERNNEHPAPFPVEIAQRAIESTSAATVFDPFMGSGSTGVAALNCGRRFIGIELDPGYCENAKARFEVRGTSLAA